MHTPISAASSIVFLVGWLDSPIVRCGATRGPSCATSSRIFFDAV